MINDYWQNTSLSGVLCDVFVKSTSNGNSDRKILGISLCLHCFYHKTPRLELFEEQLSNKFLMASALNVAQHGTCRPRGFGYFMTSWWFQSLFENTTQNGNLPAQIV